jgi:hypothetical protein
MCLHRLLVGVLSSAFIALCTRAQNVAPSTLPNPTVTPATDGILAAFQTHPLVGLSDWHGMAQEEDFCAQLVKDPRFAKKVGNVVVEFGDAAQQDTLDRYLAGEDVPYDQLRRVWSDTVGAVPTIHSMGYPNFFAQVRATNANLPEAERIQVWLGDPPIDWSKVKTREEFVQVLHGRGRYPANLIMSQILAKHKKALVIYGCTHFYDKDTIGPLIEQDYPGAFFLVTPYIGFNEESCSSAFEATLHGWPVPALATPVRNTTLQPRLEVSGCTSFTRFNFAPEVTEAAKKVALKSWDEETSGVTGDALLFLGPAAKLTTATEIPDLYLDPVFRKEISRRRMVVSGRPLAAPTDIQTSQSPLRSYGNSSSSVNTAK